jgi:hypothetical protein
MACSGVSKLMGGKTPKASAVRKKTLRGWPAIPSVTMLLIRVMGYEPRVFSVMASESRSSARLRVYHDILQQRLGHRVIA